MRVRDYMEEEHKNVTVYYGDEIVHKGHMKDIPVELRDKQCYFAIDHKKGTCVISIDKLIVLKGSFFENERITVSINGRVVNRKVRYNRTDGLYIIYNHRKFFKYEEWIYKKGTKG